MKSKNIYTLHEYGAPSHFYGLEYLVNSSGGVLKHRELNLYRQIGSSIKRLNSYKFYKCLINISFLISLLFTTNKKIVVGIAPYNNNLRYLKFLFKNHQIYYFTSYTCWDQSRMVHSKYFSDSLLAVWKDFLNNQVKHIFAVSVLTKNELIDNKFSIPEKITVVNHSFNIKIEPSVINVKTLNFITVGQLSYTKGIVDLLKIFKDLPYCNLTIVGDGQLREEVEEASKSYSNIYYKGYVKGLDNLIPIYKENSFLILNSQKSETWEELFGLVIIEAMACGLIPIATNHPGPTEIITHGLNGFLYHEGDILKGVENTFDMKEELFRQIKNEAIKKSQQFQSSEISEKWKAIL